MSIQSQEAELAPYIEREGLYITKVFREAKSAKMPGRPLFDEMMAMLQRGEIDAICSWHINRLSRNEKDSGDLRWLLRSGIIKEIRTPNKTYYPEDNAFLLAVETAAGEQFIQDLIAGSHRGTVTKLKSGGVPFKAPAGYRNNRLTKTVEIDPDTFPVVRKAWDMFLSGLCNIDQIRESVPLKLSLSRWYILFDSLFYTGQFLYMGVVYKGNYPPMISLEEYQRGQDLLGKNVSRKSGKHQFAYSHLFKCEECGTALVGDRKKKVLANGNTLYYVYYACAAAIKGHCNRKSIREDRLTKQAEHELSQVTLDADFWELAKKINLRHAEENVEVSNRIQDQQVKILKELNHERLEFARMRAKGKISEDIFDSEDARLDKEIKMVQKNMQTSHQTVNEEWQAVNDVFEFSVSMLESFKVGDDQMKNWILKKFGNNHRFNAGEVFIEPNEMMVAVRTYVQSAEYQKEKFELQKIGSHINEIADPMAHVPAWRHLVEVVRTGLVINLG